MITGNSRPIESTQAAPHPRLRDIVERHLRQTYRRVPSDAGRRAFDAVATRLAGIPFVLDAGCGTGASTFALARQFPDRVVLGIDKSEARLAAGRRIAQRNATTDNAILLHCELVDFWQLAAEAGLVCERVFLLYPNPWPKAVHVMRRWHAHPVLPALLALRGAIELRTNWAIYAQEFAQAMRIAGWSAHVELFKADVLLTPFERKYAASGHAFWRGHAQCTAALPGSVTMHG
ncbi:MAG TPA: methyltransferase domain-containing protein [Rudaea sp.]